MGNVKPIVVLYRVIARQNPAWDRLFLSRNLAATLSNRKYVYMHNQDKDRIKTDKTETDVTFFLWATTKSKKLSLFKEHDFCDVLQETGQ